MAFRSSIRNQQGGKVTARYRYEHPDESGVGRNVRDTNEPDAPRLEDRPAEVMGAIPLAALDFLDLTDEQKEKAAAMHTLTMADLDMPNGTEVTLAINGDPDMPDEPLEHNGQVVVEWTDRYGTERRTAFDPAFFNEHFTEVKG
jgi:hypothetical protein